MKADLAIFCKSSKSSSDPNNHYRAGGLSSNALHTVEVLRSLGVTAGIYSVAGWEQLQTIVLENRLRFTHVVIEAVWTDPAKLANLAEQLPGIQFVVRAHSKIGFLQVEPEAIPKIRELIYLQKSHLNLHFSSNNLEFCTTLSQIYGPVLYLPNLYDLSKIHRGIPRDGQPLKVASFGASRLLKLHPNAALAALELARLRNQNLEFYINSDSTPGGESVRKTIRNLFAGLSWAKLIEISWLPADVFRQTIAEMDLVLQLSATETFCLVAADAVAAGVPVVAGPAICWLPRKFQAEIDDTEQTVNLCLQALSGTNFRKREYAALHTFSELSKSVWLEWLGDCNRT